MDLALGLLFKHALNSVGKGTGSNGGKSLIGGKKTVMGFSGKSKRVLVGVVLILVMGLPLARAYDTFQCWQDGTTFYWQVAPDPSQSGILYDFHVQTPLGSSGFSNFSIWQLPANPFDPLVEVGTWTGTWVSSGGSNWLSFYDADDPNATPIADSGFEFRVDHPTASLGSGEARLTTDGDSIPDGVDETIADACSPVPETGALALFSLGLVGLGWVRFRRRKK